MDILIRQAEPDDFTAVHQIYSGSNVIRWDTELPYPSLDDYRKRLQPAEHRIKLVAEVDSAVVGYTEIQTFAHPRMRHTARVANMAVRDDMLGQGIGSESMKANIDLADNYLQEQRFFLEVWSDNKPAINLYRKYGFEVEGTHQSFGIRDGEFADAYTMARLKK